MLCKKDDEYTCIYHDYDIDKVESYADRVLKLDSGIKWKQMGIMRRNRIKRDKSDTKSYIDMLDFHVWWNLEALREDEDGK